MDMCGSRELGLEVIIVVRLGRDDNDLWQRSGDREEVMGFRRGTSTLVIICLEDKGGDGQSESQVPASGDQVAGDDTW